MKNTIIILLTIISLSSVYAQDKGVHLIHGLGGSGESWQELNNRFDNNCSTVDAHRYDLKTESGLGLDVYADAIKTELTDPSINAKSTDIAIAHSFGGGAIRKLENDDLFGGFITVGSAHQGAQLANSVLNDSNPNQPSLEFYLKGGCKEVVSDLVSALNDVSVVAYIIITIIREGEGLDAMFCDCVWKNILEKEAVGAFVGDYSSVEDLTIGGNMSNLPAPIKPSIGIQAETNHPTHWNLIDDFSNNHGDNSGGGIGDLVSSCDSGAKNLFDIIDMLPGNGSLPKKMNTTENIFNIVGEYYHAVAWTHPFRFKKYRNAGYQFEDAARWLRYSENGYAQVIGAGSNTTVSTYTVQEQQYVCDCWCQGTPIRCENWEPGCGGIFQTPPDYCSPNNSYECFDLVDVVYTEVVHHPIYPNDGVVPVANQVLTGADDNILVTTSKPSHFRETTDQGVFDVIEEKVINPLEDTDEIFHINDCPL